jgi:hypothetical protein
MGTDVGERVVTWVRVSTDQLGVAGCDAAAAANPGKELNRWVARADARAAKRYPTEIMQLETACGNFHDKVAVFFTVLIVWWFRVLLQLLRVGYGIA